MTIKPIYENKKAPCFSQDTYGQVACPALNDIPGFLYAISQKDYLLAFTILKRTNPFSGGCGRFCDHPCETSCNRAKFDSPVNIRDLERYVSDYAYERNIFPEQVKDFANKSAAIIGAGPAGLTTAYFLKLNGFKVDVFEKENLMGGMMAQGIPVFRYPTEILNYEIEYIKRLGVNLHTSASIDKTGFEKIKKEYDYVVAATGAHTPRKMGVPGESSSAVLVGLDFLKSLNLNSDFRKNQSTDQAMKTIEAGDSVAVIGGGYTAIDVARSAARLGKKVTIFYRRSEGDLNIHPGEVSQCQKEGIQFQYYLTPQEIATTRNKDNTVTVTLEKMITGEIEADGKSSIMPSGETQSTDVHTLIKAIGEIPDLDYLGHDYEIKGNQVLHGKTSDSSYIAGDARYGYARDVGMVVRAIGSGRKTASEIIKQKTKKEPAWYEEKKIAHYPSIKTRYFKKQSRAISDKLKPAQRVDNFKELTKPLTENEAIYASSRCFYCGICIQCDWCFHYSHGAIVKEDKKWSGNRSDNYFRFLEEKVTKNTRESVEACPRNAMGFTNGFANGFSSEVKTDITGATTNGPNGSRAIKEQYVTLQDLIKSARKNPQASKKVKEKNTNKTMKANT